VKWQEVQNIYPNQFVKFEIKDEDATRELLNSKNKTLVYHTSKDQIVLKIRKNIGLRRKL
jgi:hypothetical protein